MVELDFNCVTQKKKDEVLFLFLKTIIRYWLLNKQKNIIDKLKAFFISNKHSRSDFDGFYLIQNYKLPLKCRKKPNVTELKKNFTSKFKFPAKNTNSPNLKVNKI